MNIACLAWGSVVWDTRELPIRRRWFSDGPFAPVEFSRKSRNNRITLVLDEHADPVRLLWALMDLQDLDEAILALKKREDLTGKTWQKNIGRWGSTDEAPPLIPTLPEWAKAQGVDAAIWTALGPKYLDAVGTRVDERPSIKWVLSHLGDLRGSDRDNAEKYFRLAPKQIDTAYRRHVEAALGWSYRGSE